MINMILYFYISCIIGTFICDEIGLLEFGLKLSISSLPKVQPSPKPWTSTHSRHV